MYPPKAGKQVGLIFRDNDRDKYDDDLYTAIKKALAEGKQVFIRGKSKRRCDCCNQVIKDE